MDFMNQMYHDLKFHVNHFIVGYRQKYYSMDNNPRVIHTKLENQQLLSLRTFPNDKQLISKSQHFLHLNKQLDQENEEPGNLLPASSSSSSSSSTINSLDNVVKRELIAFENYKNVTFRTHNSLILKKNYSEPNLVDGYFLSFRLDLEMSGSSSEGDAAGNEEAQDKGVIKGRGREEEQQQVVSDQPLISLETETPGITDCTPSIPCTCQCHTFEKPAMESTISLTRKSNHVKDKLYNFVMNSLPRVSSNNNNNSNNNDDTCDSNDIKVKEETHVAPPVPQQAENSIDEIMSMKQDNNKIWKLVLNDISLSAARLSTGSGTIPMVNNQNIRGDFIDARIMNNENEDIFSSKSVPPSK